MISFTLFFLVNEYFVNTLLAQGSSGHSFTECFAPCCECVALLDGTKQYTALKTFGYAPFCETDVLVLITRAGRLSVTAAELTLGRACVDVSRVVHLLRASGAVLSSDATAEHDEAFTDFVSSTLGGDLPARLGCARVAWACDGQPTWPFRAS